ncbi:hypothetical protein VN97_g1895 [Penicillium thymicola]|uniref:Uncharacterized protein n=1 Tax=Penicillium thymicola TaxID=293382 RepID=A0AAI9TQX2_PENTH|nr:hypothetical protein VN97_g1895 [Penicillium thymicola]
MRDYSSTYTQAKENTEIPIRDTDLGFAARRDHFFTVTDYYIPPEQPPTSSLPLLETYSNNHTPSHGPLRTLSHTTEETCQLATRSLDGSRGGRFA